MAKKYLDDAGVLYFWQKLKDYFQVKLVSGTNIKTINNTSLLGSGNISISGGGGVSDVKVDGTSVVTSNIANIELADAGYVKADGSGNVSLNGSLTIDGHNTSVGYRNSGNGTKSLASGNSPVQISGNDLTLTAGTWLLIGAVDFPYTTNTASITGVRHIVWYQGSSAINGSRITVPAYSNIQGFNTRLQTITAVSLTQSTNFYIYGFQDSGATMTANYFWQIVRIA